MFHWGKIVITLQHYDQSPQNLAGWCKMCLTGALAVCHLGFSDIKFVMAGALDGPILHHLLLPLMYVLFAKSKYKFFFVFRYYIINASCNCHWWLQKLISNLQTDDHDDFLCSFLLKWWDMSANTGCFHDFSTCWTLLRLLLRTLLVFWLTERYRGLLVSKHDIEWTLHTSDFELDDNVSITTPCASLLTV